MIMTQELILQNSIRIDAPIEKVWDALVNPTQTKKYMFGCEALSDWKAGSPLLWQAHYEGKDTVFVKGIILEINPTSLLTYTVFDPFSGMEDIPANHLHVTYALNEEAGHTQLIVTQGDYAAVAEGERRYKEAYNGGEGWNPILAKIKKIVESE
ncbi:MAG: hypothetical protein JWO58_2303 [Chitinophagaceae bacterium]|nr:hypothetical protein [Chitinophagaceae bacterium]